MSLKDGAVGLMVGCFGVDSGFSPSVIWGTTRRYKPVEGVSAWLEHRIRRDRRNGFIRRENAQCGTGSAGFYLGRFEAKGIFLVCGCLRVVCQP